MTTRLAAAITAALLFGGMLYFALSGSSTLDAQTQGVVCATVTPTPTATPEDGAPSPTATPPPDGSIPAFPMSFSGTATVAGNPIPDCTFLYARVGEAVSGFRPIVDGKYDNLTIGAKDRSADRQPVTFHLSEDVIAVETQTYVYFPGPPDPPSLAFQDWDCSDFPASCHALPDAGAGGYAGGDLPWHLPRPRWRRCRRSSWSRPARRRR